MKSDLIHIPGAAGLDEAGRGPLAGPVFAAAVILPEHFDPTGINDSKKLDAIALSEAAARIKEEALAYAISRVEPLDIDRLNILHASMKAMEMAFLDLGVVPEEVYVDGNRVPILLRGRAQAIIKGDGKYLCIAAASILAKTARDAHMIAQAELYPGYGFERNFGYPSPEHKRALEELGPCPIHRRSYAPVQAALQPCLIFED